MLVSGKMRSKIFFPLLPIVVARRSSSSSFHGVVLQMKTSISWFLRLSFLLSLSSGRSLAGAFSLYQVRALDFGLG